MKAFTFATLATTSLAATVTLQQTACLQANTTSLSSFDVQVNALTVVNLDAVCGLELVSASGADVNAIKCQAYKDAAGKEKGSAEFTKANPASIATNPVQEGAILCVDSGAVPTAQPTTFAAVTASATLAAPTATGGASSTGNSTGGSPSTPTPSAPVNHGAASMVQMSLSALCFAGFAALLL